MTAADWIAVDWGTSTLRAWAIDAAGAVLAEGGSAAGMGRLEPGAFAAALEAVVGGWGGAPVIACGMVGARQGWVEAAYRAVPCAPLGPPLTRAPGAAREVRIVPGLSQLRPSPDVMRGEETQVAGVLALGRGRDGVVCLPGTHSKWAEVSAGEVVSFRSFMTGELFALLSTQSTLRHGLTGEGWDADAFADAVDEALARPEALAARLFGLRAGALLQGLGADTARARLSGWLIGAELAAARPWWLGRDVTVVGGGDLAGRYAAALGRLGAPARVVAGEAAVLAGLRQARTLA